LENVRNQYWRRRVPLQEGQKTWKFEIKCFHY